MRQLKFIRLLLEVEAIDASTPSSFYHLNFLQQHNF